MKKIALLVLCVLMFFSSSALAENNTALSGEETYIKVGLNFGDSAIADEVAIKTGGTFLLPEDITTFGSVFVKTEPLSNTVEVYGADNVLIKSLEDGETFLLTAGNGIININGKAYRNAVEIGAEQGKIKLINVLPLDHYLYGVLPNEIYPSWGAEALKTTAVAARSFCLASIAGKHSSDGFDVCTTTHCQVYRDMSTEDRRTNLAVDLTSGQVLTYKGKIISAMYSANNGGYTEGTENIWSAKLPYYVSKPDPYTPEDLWQVTYTPDEIEEKLVKRGEDIGEVTDVVVDQTVKSGRVISLTIHGDNGSYTLKKDAIRSFFNLRSTMFSVEKTGTKTSAMIDAIKAAEKKAGVKLASKYYTKNDVEFVFDGAGYGHGAGISQWGCKNMADMGKTYEEILGFYYEGAEITNLSDI